MAPRPLSRWLLCVIAFVTIAEQAQAQGLMDKLKKAARGKEYTVRGRLQVQDGRWLTCFDGIKAGYLSSIDLSGPAVSTTDPATGQVRVSTAAIPTIVMTRRGVVTSNNCDSLAEQELLQPDLPVGKSDTGYSDPYGCTKAEWTKDEIVARRREIMECQSEAISERAWQRAQAKSGNTDRGGSSAAAAGSDTAKANANARLQAETAAKFKEIQAQGATPTSAPTKSAEALAKDGATLCALTPAYMLKLKEEAVRFVRYDAAQGTIVVNELAGGSRRDVSVNGSAFAQRVSFNAQAIGQGGDTCGRAFWNAEAYKAASAAMSGG